MPNIDDMLTISVFPVTGVFLQRCCALVHGSFMMKDFGFIPPRPG